MKKLLVTMAILTLAITSTFATDTNKDIQLNGEVAQKQYKYTLKTGDDYISNGYTYDDGNKIDLTKTTLTDAFYIMRSSGNVNGIDWLEVTVEPSDFIGTVNGHEGYDTDITPIVVWQEGNRKRHHFDGNNPVRLYILIGYGYMEKEEAIGSFKLKIVGNIKTPASQDYSSKILVTYKYT